MFEENFTRSLWENFKLEENDFSQFSPLVLAYIGDSVFDLVIKTIQVEKGNRPVNKINKDVTSIVKAEYQAKMMAIIEEKLDEDEMSVYKRGRNAKSYTTAKNASVIDYRKATGFEAVMGYLYLSGRYGRIMELTKEGLGNSNEI